MLIVGFFCFIVYIGILGTFWLLDARRADQSAVPIGAFRPSGFCERRVALKFSADGVPGFSGRAKVTWIRFNGWPALIGSVDIDTDQGNFTLPVFVCTALETFSMHPDYF